MSSSDDVERELEFPLQGFPDETDISLRAYFNQMSESRLREYDPEWDGDKLIEWDGNFRSDGSLMLVCCERDVELEEYRTVLEEHIARRIC